MNNFEFKVSAVERGVAAEKKELAKMKKIKLNDKELKQLNKIIHSKEEKKKVHNSLKTFYCCATYWPSCIQCPVCGNSESDCFW